VQPGLFLFCDIFKYSTICCRTSISEATQSGDRLLKDPAQYPLVSALLRFSLPLQRLTTHFKFFKIWLPRFFVVENGRMYYSSGKHGHADSQEGTLSFVRSNPAPDGCYCIELKGLFMITLHSHEPKSQFD
jgi:hypothetical protein